MIRFFYHPIFILSASIITLIFIFSLNQTNQKAKLSNQSISQIQQEIDQLKQKNQQQEQQLAIKQSELNKEKIIRDQLLLKKDNEYIVQIPDIKIDEPVITTAPTISAWQSWKKEFYGQR